MMENPKKSNKLMVLDSKTKTSFDVLNTSFTSDLIQSSKKRKFCDTDSQDQRKVNDSLNDSASLCNGWEVRFLRVDLATAETIIDQMKKEIQQQNIIQNELELKYSRKEKCFESEKDILNHKISEYQKFIKIFRKTEHQAKEEISAMKNQITIQKQSHDKQVLDLQNHHEKTIEDLKNEIKELKQNSTQSKQIDGLEKSLKTHHTMVQKLQKKMKLLQSERDTQKEMLDSYEKGNHSQQNEQLHQHVKVLKDTLIKYKEKYTELKIELVKKNELPINIMEITLLKRDLEKFRNENEKLQKLNNELQKEVDSLKGTAAQDERVKVLHLKNNPAAIAQEKASNEVAKLKAEVQRLRVRNRKLQEKRDEATSTVTSTTTMNMTMNMKDLQKLREENKTLAAKFKENEGVFKKINQELREVVYMLFGYKVDRYGNSNYRITSMFAEDPNDNLLFQMSNSGTLNMLETNYSKILNTFMSQYLSGSNGSLAAFTSALTMELVNKITVTTT